jgi:hypothetical protein
VQATPVSWTWPWRRPRLVHELCLLEEKAGDDYDEARQLVWKLRSQEDLDRYLGQGRLHSESGDGNRDAVVLLEHALCVSADPSSQLVYTPYPAWAKEFFNYRTSQSTSLEREVVQFLLQDEVTRRAYGPLTALFQGESFALQAAVVDSSGAPVKRRDGEPKRKCVLEVDALLLTADPTVLLCVEAKSSPTDTDVTHLVKRAAVLDKALESCNPMGIVNFPPELEHARAAGARIVALLAGGSFSPAALRAAKRAGVVPVVRSGIAFCLSADVVLPHSRLARE